MERWEKESWELSRTHSKHVGLALAPDREIKLQLLLDERDRSGKSVTVSSLFIVLIEIAALFADGAGRGRRIVTFSHSLNMRW